MTTSPQTSGAADVPPPDLVEPRSYWERRLGQHDGLAGVGYLKLGAAYNRWLYAVRRTVFRRLLADVRPLAEARRVLDVGSGTGFYVEEWLRGGRDVTASDLTEVAVSRLRARIPAATVRQLDIGAAQLPADLPRDHDVVSAFDMLFHIVDDGAYANAIRNCRDLLRPGGHFVLSELLLHHGRETVPHMVSRSKVEVEALLAANGLEIVERRPMFVLMNYPLDASGLGGRLAQLAWTGMVAPCALPGVGEAYGWLLGAVLAPIERVLVGMLRGSATTEILVCRRTA